MNKINLLSNAEKFVLLKRLGDLGFSSSEILSQFISFEYGLVKDMTVNPLNAHFRLKLREVRENGVA